jgi:D-alanyl-lipoteichoic acid acyltransferase DltB (MBOAT superfamily)
MTLTNLFILITIALVIRIFPIKKIRHWLLLVASIVLIYWLQPALPIRYLDFYLPTLLIGIIVLSWRFLSNPEIRKARANITALVVIVVVVLVINLTRFTSLSGVITPSRPPSLVFLPILITFVFLVGFGLRKYDWKTNWLWTTAFFGLMVLMLVLKNPEVRLLASKGLRSLQGQNLELAGRFDIQWLGFSYVVFRLIHTIKDFQGKRLKDIDLLNYVNYVLFFPSYTAGPIDRIQHFLSELSIERNISLDDLSEGAWRLLIGVFKKFAVADTLAIVALNPSLISSINKTSYVWLSLYAYALLIYFDFSGYTDIAIGLGRIVGIQLPENFNTPYLKPNLKLFWDNWHMTLTQWFRAYYFNPVSRKIRRQWKNMPVAIMIFLMQLTTMLLIGLWHGATWNFVVWGLWHGIGMFLHNRWNEWITPRKEKISSVLIKKSLPVFGVLLTFHYVAFGWVWFALPTLSDSIHVFRLLGGG